MTKGYASPRQKRPGQKLTKKGTAKDPNAWWKGLNCDTGIKLLKDNTDPEYRERVLARKEKKRRADD